MGAWDAAPWKTSLNGNQLPRIMVVDDDPEVIELVTHILENIKCEVVPRFSGEEAWESLLASQTTPEGELDLILLDVMMTGMDGYELCQRIKKHKHLRFTPVLMMTALASVDDKTLGLGVGADDYITKPFDPRELLARVGAMLRIRHMELELRQRNRALERSQAQLVQAEKMAAVGRLAASIAHEINNPLQAIHNSLYLTLRPTLPEEKRTYYLMMAQEEVERLIDIVRRLLEFYRPSRGKPAVTDVNHVIENVLALMNKRLQHGRVTVVPRLAPELPSLRVVPDQLAQVFLNIVINAVEAMSEGGILMITTRLADNGKWVQIAFRDNGPGMDAETKASIFEPFFTTKGTGTGLGLAISYGIIERHGGRIQVDSTPGNGSIFAVYLPVIQVKPSNQGGE
jgi:two-component system NtrC family sensor kinase